MLLLDSFCSLEQLVEMDMAEALVSTIWRGGGGGDDATNKMCANLKAVSLILLSQIPSEGGQDSSPAPLVPRSALVSKRFMQIVVLSLEAKHVDERLAAMRILLRCVAEDGHCWSSIIEKTS